ncbi:4-hydroxy-tetrahydrodipicolinate reductase [Tepidamorphus sp. 3E244]|uniref:4-hydroxy-tetrahydrodipicolinate reductase n=1 Tax=Tepidamorphus sp. 3E244 TaxID=3385498 RepID=UPI0038FBE6D8
MNVMRFVVVGAAGRMGQALMRVVSETENCELVGAIEREGSDAIGKDSGELAGLGHNGIAVTDDPIPCFANCEAVLDFTSPASSVAFAELAAQARIVHVIGTTGIEAEQIRKFDAAGRHARIVRSGNMSLGVNLLAALTKKVAAALDADFDIEIVEMHHKHKVDAPSGTAYMLGEAAAEGRGISLDTHGVFSRHGQTGARKRGDIGFATLRGGSVIGDHEAIFAGEGERLTLAHQAGDRSIFARGAVKAAIWAHDKKPGHYSMADVLGLSD